MKKSSLAFLLIIISILLFFIYEKEFSSSFLGNIFSEDKKCISSYALSFMEDIRFKDFVRAAAYHSKKDQEKVNIPYLIERIFQIKPEFLDIMEYKILETSIDSSGKRGRVKIRSKIHILNSDEIKNPEIILYFHKKDKWYMELESSLK